MRDHRQLEVWQAAKALALATYSASKSLPKDERFGLVAQMRRCSVSLVSNIAEGVGRYSQRDFLRFLDIAAGSASELMTQAEIVIDMDLARADEFRSVLENATRVKMMLAHLTKTTRRSS